MFYLLPTVSTMIIAVYIGAAIIPALFLMRCIYKADKIEKESPFLLFTLVLTGVGAALIAILLETIGERLLTSCLDEGSPYYTAVFAFLVVAVAEEGAKLLLLYLRTWRIPDFNYRFDGIVYSAFVSLGFAAYENIRYVISYGLSVAVPRALLAIPGHLGFAVFMGIFYSRAKFCDRRGDKAGRNLNLAAAYISSVLLHGFYDTCAMIDSAWSTVTFVIFVAVMYIVVINLVKRESASDRRI